MKNSKYQKPKLKKIGMVKNLTLAKAGSNTDGVDGNQV